MSGLGSIHTSGYTYQPSTIAIGNSARLISNNSVAIGSKCIATGSYSVCIGANVQAPNPYDIQIGQKTDKGDVFIANINIRELKEKVTQLEEIIEKQQEMLSNLWYAPGMPGASEAKEMWEKDKPDEE